MQPHSTSRFTAAGASAPAEGVRLGDWVLVSPLGAGSMATVHAARPARSPAAPPAYAVKLLLPRWQDEPRAVDLLRREALVARAVSHTNLISIFASQTSRPPFYLVMPLLAGETLATRLARGWRPPPSIALWIARQVADALGALSRAGWMHGDVKPGNIFLSPQGHATLIDLGFARRLDEDRCAADRPVMGTLSYMAPEALTSKLRADVRSDIYSLGVTLYEMLAGRLPLTGDDAAETAVKQRLQPPAALRSLVPLVPGSVAELVHAMLAKEPLRRPQSPTELLARLTALEIETFLAGRFEEPADEQTAPIDEIDLPSNEPPASGNELPGLSAAAQAAQSPPLSGPHRPAVAPRYEGNAAPR